MGKELDVRGVLLFGATGQEEKEAAEELEEVLGWGRYAPIVAASYSLEQSQQAHLDVINPPGGARGNLILIP
jgi:NADPH:quinone reductase-like Zn-dependent oxidoreductase